MSKIKYTHFLMKLKILLCFHGIQVYRASIG